LVHVLEIRSVRWVEEVCRSLVVDIEAWLALSRIREGRFDLAEVPLQALGQPLIANDELGDIESLVGHDVVLRNRDIYARPTLFWN